MSEKETKGSAKKKPSKLHRWKNLLRRRNVTSIYFLLWAIFVTLSFVILTMSVFMQQYVAYKSYKEEASKE